jgi:LysR family transcriptional regulator, glycine cleavage system transcriptional activator
MSLLIAFEASARNLSFTRAAAELAVTQSAVSRQVQALEELLGVALFRREGRQIELTDVGAMYLRELGGALQRIRKASLQAVAYRSGGGSLQLAALPTFASKWLMPRLNEFMSRHPDILVHVHARIGQFDLERAGMDAAISVSDAPWPGVEAHRLLDETLLPVISPHLAAKVRNARSLSDHVLLQVVNRPDVWHQWFATYQVEQSRMRLGPQFELTSHLIQAVAAGVGVGLVPGFLVEDELRSGALALAIDLPLKSGMSYYLFVEPSRTSMPPLAAFKDWLLRVSR